MSHQQTLLEERFTVYSRSNEMKSVDECTAWLFQLGDTMETKVETGAYMRPGGHREFLEDELHIVEFYNSMSGKGIKALEVLQDFLRRNKNIEAGIMQADENLTEDLKTIRAREAEAEAAKREREILEMQNRHQEKLRLAEQHSFEQHKRMLQEKMEADRAQIIRENRWLIDQEVQEMENLKNEEFQVKILKLQTDIEKLKSETNTKEKSGVCVIA